ncbi:MAG: DUF2339 domain-containing protein [Lachnospiraceae bacterium]|nr:DUF2339 domain-containing protein [Lachnospiraceae bacterium]
MDKRLSKILDYEKQLIQSRQQLLGLLVESEEADSELLQYKLQCFQKEIAFMNRQVELLKQASGVEREVSVAAVQEKVTGQIPVRSETVQEGVTQEGIVHTESLQVGTAQPDAVHSEVAQPTGAQTGKFSEAAIQPEAGFTDGMQAAFQRVTTGQNTEPAKKDLEKTVGKSLMGIFASALIFISLILFATLLLPYFNDTAKMLTTYLVSFAFLSIGLTKLNKDKTNKFYMALTGCGIGALYISLLLSNMYFKVLGDIPLYVLLCIWGVGVCFFAKQQSRIFQIIGELGITIAMLFGCILCIDNEDNLKFLALIIFYMVSAGVFYGVHFKREFIDNLIHHIFNIINVFLLAVSCFEIVGNGLEHFESWAVLLLIAVGLASTLWHTVEKESISFGIFASAYVLIGFGMLDTILYNWETRGVLYGIVAYVVAVVLLVVFECKKTKGNIGKYLVMAVLLLEALDALEYRLMFYDYSMIFLLIIPLMVAGFLRKNRFFQYAGLVLLGVYTFEYNLSYDDEWIHFLLETLPIITGFVLLWWKKEQYSAVFKYALHIITLVFIYNSASDAIFHLLPIKYRSGFNDIPDICSYVLFTGFNIAMMKSVFAKNLLTGEKEKPTIYNIANMLSMIVGIFMIADGGDGFWHMLLILTVLGAFFINAKNLLDKRENLLTGIYVGIKFAILMITILYSFDAENYVISIACLLLAIGSIVLGFLGEYKSLRVFGLLLSMISIFKLIMVDISYDNTLGHAISFFVSGILCFVISMIYNYIDKKFAERA